MTAGEAHCRKIEAVLAAAGELPETAEKQDTHFMKLALALAQAAAEDGEVPVGCVIVREGKVLSADYNGRETFRDAAYHAETAAISSACRKLGGWRLTGCTLYVTLEPCPKCAGAILNAHIPRVVYGAADEKNGACGSLVDVLHLPGCFQPEVEGGLLADECAALLSGFFRMIREKRKNRPIEEPQ